jgi:hypothetical protein
MQAWKKALVYVAWSGVIIAAFSGSVLLGAAQQGAGSPERASLTAKPVLDSDSNSDSKSSNSKSDEQPAKASELPDSPGATLSRSQDAQQQNTTQLAWGAAPLPPQSTSPQSTSPQPTQAQPSQAQSPQKPVGTAVAEAPNAGGVSASQPAGVAIAPAKQRRVRTIVLRMGAIVGAGVAVGSVVALTAATSSKPPGAH